MRPMAITSLSSIDGQIASAASVLPDISTQNTTKTYQKAHTSLIFSEKMTSGNSEVVFVLGVRGTLNNIIVCKLTNNISTEINSLSI